MNSDRLYNIGTVIYNNIMNPIKHDYNGITINQRSEDGYINLNEMAQATNKRVDNWLQNKSTQDLIAQFNLEVSYNSSATTLDSSELTKDRSLNSSNDQPALITSDTKVSLGGGTWAHPDIAIQFAQWCSPTFALQVSRWVREWLMGHSYSQMDDDQLQIEQIDADLATLRATVKRSQAKIEKKLRDRQWFVEKRKHKQLAIEMGEIIDDSDRNSRK